MQGEPIERCKSPVASSTNFGSTPIRQLCKTPQLTASEPFLQKIELHAPCLTLHKPIPLPITMLYAVAIAVLYQINAANHLASPNSLRPPSKSRLNAIIDIFGAAFPSLHARPPCFGNGVGQRHIAICRRRPRRWGRLETYCNMLPQTSVTGRAGDILQYVAAVLGAGAGWRHIAICRRL